MYLLRNDIHTSTILTNIYWEIFLHIHVYTSTILTCIQMYLLRNDIHTCNNYMYILVQY